LIGHQDRWREDLFIACPLRDLVPDDHILKRVDRVLDLSWLRQDVAECYCLENGRPSIDPEAAVRLMLAGFFYGIVHDRKLMREAQANLAMRWFAGFKPHEPLPDHSSLTRIRQRWGEGRFKRIFQRTVDVCRAAGLVDGEVVHIDATLIRADVSWKRVVEQHAERVLEENPGDEDGDDKPSGSAPRRRGRPRSRPAEVRKQSLTDPEATLTTSSHDRRMEFCYKQHTAVDDRAGVLVDVNVTTGAMSEGSQLLEQMDRVQANTGRVVRAVTADAGYAHPRNYGVLEQRGVVAVIPPQREQRRPRRIPVRRFRYDARHDVVRCPGGKELHRATEAKNGWLYRARPCDCRVCPLRTRCIAPSAHSRTILIVRDYPALLRARRDKERGWDEDKRALYRRHQWLAEGKHGEAKERHGLRRAVRRGRWNVAVQAYLAAAVMNLKCLVTHGGRRPAVVQALQTLGQLPHTVGLVVRTLLRLLPRTMALHTAQNHA
jgi:transposase/nitroreductase